MGCAGKIAGCLFHADLIHGLDRISALSSYAPGDSIRGHGPDNPQSGQPKVVAHLNALPHTSQPTINPRIFRRPETRSMRAVGALSRVDPVTRSLRTETCESSVWNDPALCCAGTCAALGRPAASVRPIRMLNICVWGGLTRANSHLCRADLSQDTRRSPS